MDSRISLVIATHNRRESLGRTLVRSLALPESPPVILVDNGSSDGTSEFVQRAFPAVRLIALTENLGAAARTVGARSAETPYVAFSDDDSWWAPGSLSLAGDWLDVHPRLALVAARILVGPEETLDPVCIAMASSPLAADDGLPGPAVLGFLACGAVLRRAAILEVGGFEVRYGVGGEEELLAIDLAATGWSLVYCEGAVAYHHPDIAGPRPSRRRRQYRNALWSAWLRRPLSVVMRRTARAIAEGIVNPEARSAFLDAVAGLPWIVRSRRVIPGDLERSLRVLGR